MHAYLVISKNEDQVIPQVKKQADIDDYKFLEFALQKIEDARNFNSFLKLSLSEKTAIVVKNFHLATEECTNAILKKIEEPQENLIFIIHTKNENLILPTIKSRCQIIRITENVGTNDLSDTENFMQMDLTQKWTYLSSIKERGEVLRFCDNLIEFFTRRLKTDSSQKPAYYAKSALSLRKAIEANGNINLQLLCFLNSITLEV